MLVFVELTLYEEYVAGFGSLAAVSESLSKDQHRLQIPSSGGWQPILGSLLLTGHWGTF